MPMFHFGACTQSQITVYLDSLSFSVKIQAFFILASVCSDSCQEPKSAATVHQKR